MTPIRQSGESDARTELAEPAHELPRSADEGAQTEHTRTNASDVSDRVPAPVNDSMNTEASAQSLRELLTFA